MHMDLFYKFILVILPIVFMIGLISKYRKGQYNPNMFAIKEGGSLKRFIFFVVFFFSADQISDKFFLNVVLMTILIGYPVVITILNFKVMSIKSDKSILLETLIMDFFFLMIFLGTLAARR